MNKLAKLAHRAKIAAVIAGTAMFLAAGMPRMAFAQEKAKLPIVPINFASHVRLSPNTWVGKGQFVYAIKAVDGVAPTHIRMLWLGDGSVDAGLMMVKNPNGSEVFGAAGRKMLDGFGGKVGGCVRVAVQRAGSTSTALVDVSMNAERIGGLPVSVIGSSGNSENFVSGYYSDDKIGISATYRNNRKDGASLAGGADYDVSIGNGISERIFASFSHSFATGRGVFGAGTRVNASIGNAEIVCWTDGPVLGRLAIYF